MSRLKFAMAIACLGAATLSAVSFSDSKAETTDGLTIMTFKQWDDVKAGCVIQGTDVYSRLGSSGPWKKEAALWDKDCVKRSMKEKGYAKAVVFDPDEMFDFKKKTCDLYETSVVTVDGVVVERKFGSAFEQCQ